MVCLRPISFSEVCRSTMSSTGVSSSCRCRTEVAVAEKLSEAGARTDRNAERTMSFSSGVLLSTVTMRGM